MKNDYNTLVYSVEERVATIVLNRPERLNALTFELLDELHHAVKTAEADPNVHVLVLKGNGAAFCAGYDLDISTVEESQRDEKGHNIWDPIADYVMINRCTDSMMSLFRCRKPVIAQVHGWAVGGGADMVLCADLIIASEDAKFGYPPARVWGSPTTAMWALRLGMERAKRFLFTGDSIDAPSAAQMGMILECVPREKLDETVERLVFRIAMLPLNQLIMMKLFINQMYQGTGILDNTQVIGTLLDGIARHTPEGIAWRESAIQFGIKHALKERDGRFGDYTQRKKQ
ncbi:crotonase/enoyl-CoA hydratase family protein [Effusibacillus pohliae]|uniref:crotonase/enoyl-CoA hydratase family protein n=1 Tax=Effusibacillus pohliae TaxID=232270 RepID=UPI0003A69A34|nr:crotonase/enoyl-CoA hydratase family protein [Effusibacillus pohliae]